MSYAPETVALSGLVRLLPYCVIIDQKHVDILTVPLYTERRDVFYVRRAFSQPAHPYVARLQVWIGVLGHTPRA